MKCARCFRELPERERYEWGVDERGSVRKPHIVIVPFYTCLTCGKNYCINCWRQKICKDFYKAT